MIDEHVVKLNESQRQMVLLALASLALQRPGRNKFIMETALLMDNRRPDHKPEMFEEFKKYNSDRIKPLAP